MAAGRSSRASSGLLRRLLAQMSTSPAANHTDRRAVVDASSRLVAPAAERNKDVILAALAPFLPAARDAGSELHCAAPPLVIEIASGTGQHCAHFAASLPHIRWQPTDCVADNFDSIRSWAGGFQNCLEPRVLDAASHPDKWDRALGLEASSSANVCAIFAANITHIAPFEATVGLIRGAGRILSSSAAGQSKLIIYGPFKIAGAFTTPSNAQFDASLREQNPAWGYRDVEQLESLARENGLELEEVCDMPANNHLLCFSSRSTVPSQTP